MLVVCFVLYLSRFKISWILMLSMLSLPGLIRVYNGIRCIRYALIAAMLWQQTKLQLMANNFQYMCLHLMSKYANSRAMRPPLHMHAIPKVCYAIWPYSLYRVCSISLLPVPIQHNLLWTFPLAESLVPTTIWTEYAWICMGQALWEPRRSTTNTAQQCMLEHPLDQQANSRMIYSVWIWFNNDIPECHDITVTAPGSSCSKPWS